MIAGACPLAATAVPFEFTGSSYQQLQRTDDYSTFCQTGEPYDVPPGTYTLLTFAGGPATRETVTVGEAGDGDSTGSALSPIRLVRETTVPRLQLTDVLTATASCPAG